MNLEEFNYYFNKASNLKDSDLKNLGLVLKSIYLIGNEPLFDECLILFIKGMLGEEEISNSNRLFNKYKTFIQNQVDIIKYFENIEEHELKKIALNNYLFLFQQFSLED
jgi:hypothetical protein